jgi:hypothetical protein
MQNRMGSTLYLLICKKDRTNAAALLPGEKDFVVGMGKIW